MWSIINCIDCGYLSDKKREFVKLKLIHWHYSVRESNKQTDYGMDNYDLILIICWFVLIISNQLKCYLKTRYLLLVFSNKNKIYIWNRKKITNQWMSALWLSMDDSARIWNLNKEQTLLNMNGEFLFPKSCFIVTAINEKRMFERNKNVYGGKKYLRCKFPSSITHTSLTLQIKGMNQDASCKGVVCSKMRKKCIYKELKILKCWSWSGDEGSC